MIKIIALGKIKEKFFVDAITEYEKRISKYVKLQIIELPDNKGDNKQINLLKETESIKSKINERDYVITTEIEGKMITSEDLSTHINNLNINGNSDITFIIGSSHGLSDEIKKRANYHLSFSKMTFPHQLFRIFLLEQIYRSYKIMNNEKYHK